VMPHKPHHKDKRPKKIKDLGEKIKKKYMKGRAGELLEGGTGRSFIVPKREK
jgi:hypothetical protein